MKVLYISNKPLFPNIDGGTVAMSSFLSLLQELDTIEVVHLCFSTEKHPFNYNAYPVEIRNNCQIENIAIDTSIRKVAAIKHLISGQSYHLSRFNQQLIRSKVEALQNAYQFDFIIGESIYSLKALEGISFPNTKVICRTHNVEFNIWKNLSDNSTGLKKWYLTQLVKSLKREEITLLNNIDGILSISDVDSSTFKELGIETPIQFLPVTIPVSDYSVDYSSNKFHHLGAMNWQPNLELVNDLVTTIFPKIRKELPDAELHLAGSYFPEHIVSIPENGIFTHGFIDDKLNFHNQYGIQLVPLKSGSGIRIKLLESMAIGVPNVTTPKGAEGIDYQYTKAVIVCDSIDQFVDKAVELAKNDDLRREVGQEAKKQIQSTYSIEIGRKSLIEFIRKIS